MGRPVRTDRKPKETPKRPVYTSLLDDVKQRAGYDMSPTIRGELERPEPNWKPGWQQEVLARRMGGSTGTQSAGGMPAVARARLERALCSVLERRYPGQRFTMKGEQDAGGQGSASTGDADRLKDGL
jgi:hypothetical protein